MLKKTSLLILSILILFYSTSVNAAPLKAESKNIILYGDVSPKIAKQTLEKMEIYRRLIMTLGGLDPYIDDEEKITIYAFDNGAQLRSFAGARGVAGLYTSDYEGHPMMLTTIASNEKQNSFDNQVMLHEYSHHILHYYMDGAYPRWYDEGHANYLSCFKMLEDNVLEMGSACAKHAQGIMKGGFKWVDIEDVISSIRVYPFSNKSGRKRGMMMNQFYAQSWLYVSYLQANTKLNRRLGAYLELIRDGDDPIESFEEGFGVKAKDFHKAAKKYFESDKFSVQQYRPGPDFFKVKVSRKKLSAGEVNMQMALGQRNFLKKSTLSSYVKKINSYEKEFGQTSESMNARSLYYQHKENYDDAIKYAQSALGLERDNINSLRMLGDIYFHKSHDSKFEELEDTEPRLYTLNEDLEISINHFETVLKYNDEDFTSTDHLLRIYGSSDIPLTSAARNAAIVYEEVHDKGFDPSQTLNLANVYLKSGKLTAACKYFETVKKQAETDPDKDKYSLFNHVELLKPSFEEQCEI